MAERLSSLEAPYVGGSGGFGGFGDAAAWATEGSHDESGNRSERQRRDAYYESYWVEACGTIRDYAFQRPI